MVHLNHLRQGDGSRSWIPEFVAALNEFLDPTLDENQKDGRCLVPLRAGELAPPEFLDRIDSGFENYSRLRFIWDDLVGDLNRVESLPALIRQEQ